MQTERRFVDTGRVDEVFIEVPANESFDLDTFKGFATIRRVSGIHGELVLQIAMILSWFSYRLLRTWLLSQTDRVKNVKVIWNGNEFKGLSGREVEELLDRMEKNLPLPPTSPTSDQEPPKSDPIQ
jgi:hypothetical protein